MHAVPLQSKDSHTRAQKMLRSYGLGFGQGDIIVRQPHKADHYQPMEVVAMFLPELHPSHIRSVFDCTKSDEYKWMRISMEDNWWYDLMEFHFDGTGVMSYRLLQLNGKEIASPRRILDAGVSDWYEFAPHRTRLIMNDDHAYQFNLFTGLKLREHAPLKKKLVPFGAVMDDHAAMVMKKELDVRYRK